MPALTRRTFLFSALAGGTIGAGWSGALVYSQRVHSPRIDVIGDRETQLVLLDTGGHRMLFALGPPSDWLAENLSAMIGPFRRTIDLVVSDGEGIAGLRSSNSISLDARSWLAIGTDQYTASPYGDRTISEPMRIDLSASVSVVIDPYIGPSSWIATCQRGNSIVALAPRVEALAYCRTRPLVGISPTGNLRLALRQRIADTLVCNAALLDEQAQEVPWLRTYADEPARIDVGSDRITMPAWLERPSP